MIVLQSISNNGDVEISSFNDSENQIGQISIVTGRISVKSVMMDLIIKSKKKRQ